MTIGSRVWTRSRRRWGISARLAGKVGQPVVGQHQRVPSAEDHLLDRLVGGDLGWANETVLPMPAHCWAAIGKMPAKAETAVDAARRHLLRSIVCPYTSRSRPVRRRPPPRPAGRGRIAALGQLLPPREDLGQERIGRVARADAGQVGPGNPQRETPRPPRSASAASRGGSPSRRHSSAGSPTALGQDRLPVGPAARRRPEFGPRGTRAVESEPCHTANRITPSPSQKVKRKIDRGHLQHQ